MKFNKGYALLSNQGTFLNKQIQISRNVYISSAVIVNLRWYISVIKKVHHELTLQPIHFAIGRSSTMCLFDCLCLHFSAEQHFPSNPAPGGDEISDELGSTGLGGVAGGVGQEGRGFHDSSEILKTR